MVHAGAAELGRVLTDRGIAHADVVVSGLPWAAFPAQRQRDILDAVVDGLSPEGAFTTFAYVHSRWTRAARRFRRQLDASFDEVLVSRTVWRNVPPALVYYARRPRVSAPSAVPAGRPSPIWLTRACPGPLERSRRRSGPPRTGSRCPWQLVRLRPNRREPGCLIPAS